MSALSPRKKFVVFSACFFAAGIAGVFFMGPLALYKAILGAGFFLLIISLAALIGRGYFATALVMAMVAALADPAQVFTMPGDIEGKLILKASEILTAVRITAVFAALLLFGIGFYIRFGRKPAFILYGVFGGVALIAAIIALSANRIAASHAAEYEAALQSCATDKMQPEAERAQQGLYKYLSIRRDMWHLCAVNQTCKNALCRASFAFPTRFLDTLRLAGDRVIIAETAQKYDAVLQVCGKQLAELAEAEDVAAYVNARPHDPAYAERIDWDLLGCASAIVCEQYAEQSGVRQQTCAQAYMRMRETDSVSPTLGVMRKFNGDEKK